MISHVSIASGRGNSGPRCNVASGSEFRHVLEFRFGNTIYSLINRVVRLLCSLYCTYIVVISVLRLNPRYLVASAFHLLSHDHILTYHRLLPHRIGRVHWIGLHTVDINEIAISPFNGFPIGNKAISRKAGVRSNLWNRKIRLHFENLNIVEENIKMEISCLSNFSTLRHYHKAHVDNGAMSGTSKSHFIRIPFFR